MLSERRLIKISNLLVFIPQYYTGNFEINSDSSPSRSLIRAHRRTELKGNDGGSRR
ncbi:hypothetical protein PUN28_015481 [Cardiocondyla obscurior]|uniref:Uncharacterized protein n=1 Tax=Cardiocondyla obscurior TaxID=286306 RepID=A0AAW2EX18_9HYME